MARTMDLQNVPGHEFQFTRNWFRNRNLATFREFIYPEWSGKPINYLEIGVFEGMSLCWMLQKVLTHKDSRAVGIDPWLMTTKLCETEMEAVCQRAIHNVSLWGGRCTLMRACSAEVLRKMVGKGYAEIGRQRVDLCMVDGNHWAPYVQDDARLCWELLKPGGWLLFDDVENQIDKGTGHVKDGMRLFLKDHLEAKRVFKDRYMEAYRKP